MDRPAALHDERLRRDGVRLLKSADDQRIRQLREQISDNDRALIEAMNRRLELVAKMWSYKRSRGVDVLDPEREEWMLRYLARANRGPLSQEGLEELFSTVLALTKRELSGGS